MTRRNESTPISFDPEWSGAGHDGLAPVINTDNRWTVVSTSISALIVGTIAWLAVSTMPPVTGGTVEHASRDFLPYRLFQQLAQSSSGSFFGSNATPGQTESAADLNQAAKVERIPQKPAIETHTVTLEAGDTLAGALENAGVSVSDSNGAIEAMGKVQNPRALRAGQTFEITFNTRPDIASAGANDPSRDEGDSADLANGQPVSGEPITRLISIKFSPSVEHDITITRADDGSFNAVDTVKKLVSRAHRAGGTIDGSLYQSAMRAGIPTEVTAEMIKIMSYKVDFQRDLQPGDSFEVFYDYFYTPEGKAARQGNISYAMMKTGGRTIVLYRYQANPNDPAEYFDAHGESVKGLLMKTPVDGARVTSGFGRRFHPVLGYSRMHKGVDFGVPIGTPVMAAGSGTITFIGWSNGYGRFVKVNHGNGYATAYGHLSRFSPGLRVGSKVRQAQVIAFSGNTGMSTGPHLHYEILQNSQQVNPLKVKMAQGRKLAGKELRVFQGERLKIDDKLASTKLETRIGDVASALRPVGK